MIIREYFIVLIAVLIAGQSVGIFLAAFQDGYGVTRSLYVVKEMWHMYFWYLTLPSVIIWRIWLMPERFFDDESFTRKRQIRMTVICIFCTYSIVAKNAAKWRKEVFDSFRPASSRRRISEMTYEPVKRKLLHV